MGRQIQAKISPRLGASQENKQLTAEERTQEEKAEDGRAARELGGSPERGKGSEEVEEAELLEAHREPGTSWAGCGEVGMVFDALLMLQNVTTSTLVLDQLT
ncbi:hypothetical protein ABZP36_018447 [Zizania latifolia]